MHTIPETHKLVYTIYHAIATLENGYCGYGAAHQALGVLKGGLIAHGLRQGADGQMIDADAALLTRLIDDEQEG